MTQQKMVGGSVSFDNAADVYDATRALPPWIVEKQTEALLTELRAIDCDRLLEIGIGTGRITRPLMERGVRVAGIDISPRMLARLREQLTPQHIAPDLAFADATRLPFRDDSFRAALMVHVLHLVSDWRGAVAEMRRVLGKGGVFLHDVTRYDDDNPWKAAMDKRSKMVATRGIVMRKRPETGDIGQALRELGGSMLPVVYAEDQERNTGRQLIERAAERTDSWSWEIPDEVYLDFFAEFEAWCRDHYGDLDREYVQPVHYTLQVWTFS